MHENVTVNFSGVTVYKQFVQYSAVEKSGREHNILKAITSVESVQTARKRLCYNN